MLHHVSVGVSDVARAAKFYDAVLGALGYKRVADYSPGPIAYGESRGKPEFWIGPPHDGKRMSVGNGTHLGFTARSKAQVLKFHAAALEEGGSNNGEPGPRPEYGPEYYGAFIYDLDGNKIEAVLRAAPAVASQAKTRAKKAARTPIKQGAQKNTKKRSKR